MSKSAGVVVWDYSRREKELVNVGWVLSDTGTIWCCLFYFVL
jgi:hypothetical protein